MIARAIGRPRSRSGSILGMALALGAALLSQAQDAGAEEITLQMTGSQVVFKGELISFDENSYTVALENLGTLRLARNKFDCVGGACPGGAPSQVAALSAGPDFGIHGSNTIGAQLMPALIEGYAETVGAKVVKRVGQNPEEVQMELLASDGKKLSVVDLRSHGSGTSFPALARGEAQIGMSSRPIKEKELTFMDLAGFLGMSAPGREHILALDGLLVIVSPENPLTSIGSADLARVFAGEISNWAELGLAPGRINLYARDDKSGTYDTFNSLVLKPAKRNISGQARRFESNAELSDAVASDPLGIGFTGIAYQRNAKTLAIASDCGIVQKPSTFGVKTEEYPLSRRLFLYTTPNLTAPHGKQLLEFALSEDAQDIIVDVGFIDQTADRLPFSQQGDRLAAALSANSDSFNVDMMRDATANLSSAERLSTTFRFRSGSSELDNKALQDVGRLARLIQRSATRGRQFLLVGFADSYGPFEENRRLSLARARTVRSALQAVSGRDLSQGELQVLGFSEIMPVACNDTDRGRALNRRVEVWLR